MLPQPATEAPAEPQLLRVLSRATENAFSSIPLLKRGKGHATSHQQYEAQRNSWTQKGRGLQTRRSDGLSDQSMRAVLTDMLPSRTTTAFIITCLLWYLSSALSSNTSKALLSSPKRQKALARNALSLASTPVKTPPPFPYPVTLTLVQFAFIHLLSSAVASPTFMALIPGARRPVTRIVASPGWKRISDMAKLSVFNVLGHALSTVAISRVPVSTVHTIKALTPLFTVLSFRYLFDVHYSALTYTSLLPLTLGVMMACTSLSFSANDLLGLVTALASTFIFVAQSIYSKNLVGRGSDQLGKGKGSSDKSRSDGMTDEGKLDKINILYYTSACSVVFMIPMALYYDAPKLFGSLAAQRQAAMDAASVAGASFAPASTLWTSWLILANGLSQFAQNFLAFSVLALVSPVTYSIASLFKRVFVICFAIVWFGQQVSRLQWLGIVLTFVGLYMYNEAKTSKSAAAKEQSLGQRGDRDLRLPTTVHNAFAAFNPSGPSTPIPQRSPKAGQTAFLPHQLQMPLASQFQQQQAAAEGTSSQMQYGETAVPISMDARSALGLLRSSQDPRQSIPSPPPSRGPSSDDGKSALHLHSRGKST